MKDMNFQIKVADLLKKLGKKDRVEFEKKFTSKLPNLTGDGISGSVTLQSVNDESVLINLENINCTLNDVCDSCEAKYQRPVYGEDYMVKFISEEAYEELKKSDEEQEEDIFPMESSGDVIDIEDMVAQAIGIQEPFVKRCPVCEKKYQETDEENIDEEDLGTFNTHGNITFS